MKIDYELKEVPKDFAVSFIQHYHYSPVLPKLTKHYLGFFVNGELKGVLTLGWGTQPVHTINKMFTGLTSKHYYEIGKMCMDDDMPRNSESQMLSQTIRWLKTYHPSKLFLYTMADGIMGKCGYVYQAANFLFGEKYLTQVYMMENGEKIHPRSTKGLLVENLEWEKTQETDYGKRSRLYWMTSDYMKHKGIRFIEGYMYRYIYPLNKTAKKMLQDKQYFVKPSSVVIRKNKKERPFVEPPHGAKTLFIKPYGPWKSSLNWTKEYPKDKDLQWFDKTTRPKTEIEKPPFTFEDMKYNAKNVGNVNKPVTWTDPTLDRFFT